MTRTEATLARTLLHSVESGILSTQSLELPGYPFGSVTPFVLSACGKPVILVSDIAQHTANMNADSKSCLSVQQSGPGHQQELGRVTLVGDARKLPEALVEEQLARYYTFFPQAKHYGQAHGFSLYWIDPVRVRFIRGFGQIAWIEKADWELPVPEWQPQAADMIAHMNEDHGPALQRIAARLGAAEATQVRMLALDSEGFHLRAGDGIHYVPFEQACPQAEDVRAAMVALARAV